MTISHFFGDIAAYITAFASLLYFAAAACIRLANRDEKGKYWTFGQSVDYLNIGLLWGLKKICTNLFQTQSCAVYFPIPGYNTVTDFFDGRTIETIFADTLSHFSGIYYDYSKSARSVNTITYAFTFTRADDDTRDSNYRDFIEGLAEADFNAFLHSLSLPSVYAPLTAVSFAGSVLNICFAVNSAGCRDVNALRDQLRASAVSDNAKGEPQDIEV